MFNRGDVWWVKIRHNGKIQKSLETSDKKMAQAIEVKVRAEIIEGKYFSKPKEAKRKEIMVSDLIQIYLNDHSKPRK